MLSNRLEGETAAYAYADIANRILDCKITETNGVQNIEFSIPTSEIKKLDEFNLYLISKDEDKIAKIPLKLN